MGMRLLADVAALIGLIMSFWLVRYNRKAWFVVAFWAFEFVYRLFASERFGGYSGWAASAFLCLSVFLTCDWRWGKVAGR